MNNKRPAAEKESLDEFMNSKKNMSKMSTSCVNTMVYSILCPVMSTAAVEIIDHAERTKARSERRISRVTNILFSHNLIVREMSNLISVPTLDTRVRNRGKLVSYSLDAMPLKNVKDL